MDKRGYIAGLVGGILVLLLALAWWLGWFPKSEDPLIAEVRTAIESSPAEQTPEQQNASRDLWRDRVEGMTREQREAFFEQLAPIIVPLFMGQIEKRYDEFMKKSPEEQRRALDKEIDRMMARGGGWGGGNGAGGGGQNRPQPDPKRAAEWQKKSLAWTTPEQRSKIDNGIQLMVARIKERGLTPPPMLGGGFF